MRTAVGVSSPDSVSIPSATPSRGLHTYACACTSLLLGVISEYEITVGGFVWGDKVFVLPHPRLHVKTVLRKRSQDKFVAISAFSRAQ